MRKEPQPEPEEEVVAADDEVAPTYWQGVDSSVSGRLYSKPENSATYADLGAVKDIVFTDEWNRLTELITARVAQQEERKMFPGGVLSVEGMMCTWCPSPAVVWAFVSGTISRERQLMGETKVSISGDIYAACDIHAGVGAEGLILTSVNSTFAPQPKPLGDKIKVEELEHHPRIIRLEDEARTG